MVRTLAGVPQVGSPVRLDGERADCDLPPPKLGEHTADLLRALGVSSSEAERLRAAKVIA
jgi:crotonobetainyl-CoA:carnitine CoA-transferase CaiB-like acyl-CoA transferase